MTRHDVAAWRAELALELRQADTPTAFAEICRRWADRTDDLALDDRTAADAAYDLDHPDD